MLEDIIKFFLSVGGLIYIRTFHRKNNIHGIFNNESDLRTELSNLNDLKGL